MSFYDNLKAQWTTWARMPAAEKDAAKDVITANPHHAFLLKRARDEAIRYARNLAGAFAYGLTEAEQEARYRASIEDGPADAIRHCYWSALLARDLGYNDALRLVATHEFNDLTSLAARMDLHNDRVGLEIGTRHKGAPDLELQQRCLEALLTAQLVVIDPRLKQLAPSKSLVPIP